MEKKSLNCYHSQGTARGNRPRTQSFCEGLFADHHDSGLKHASGSRLQSFPETLEGAPSSPYSRAPVSPRGELYVHLVPRFYVGC